MREQSVLLAGLLVDERAIALLAVLEMGELVVLPDALNGYCWMEEQQARTPLSAHQCR